MTMTREQLLDAVCALLPAQFDVMLLKLGVPPAYLSGTQAPLATRAIELMRHLEGIGRLSDLVDALASVRGAATVRQPYAAGAPVDFIILTALAEERDAVLARLPGHRRLDGDGVDGHVYYEAELATRRTDRGVYRVLVTIPARMGPLHAAITASAVTERHRPGHVLLVGIAGGLRDEVTPGDVIVADAVADYTLGKVHGDGAREIRWTSYPADGGLLMAANAMQTGWHDLLGAAGPNGGEPPRCHTGVVASGGDVIASKDLIGVYRKDWPKLLGVEMEGGGVAAAMHHHRFNPGFLMIRGVSDLADGDDNAATKRQWRARACEVAAAFAVGLLREGPVPARRPM